MRIEVALQKCSKTSLRIIIASSEVTCLSPLTSAAAMITDHPIIWASIPCTVHFEQRMGDGNIGDEIYYQKECNE